MIEIKRTPFWIFYSASKEVDFDSKKCGKWMYFFDDIEYAEAKCKEAIESGAIKHCKHSNADNGVACFYLHCDDIEAHKKILSFFLDKKLIKRTKAGKLYNIPFKLDIQTRAGEYGSGFESEIKLEKFVDLTTGEWIYGGK